jgi:hypothetical protein
MQSVATLAQEFQIGKAFIFENLKNSPCCISAISA